ncbi:MAG: NUDIX domain-containing protein [Caldilineales bacterium]|nr:NUDIX domain-containing protein [Caldilineales bacterium]
MTLSFPTTWLHELDALDAAWAGGDGISPAQIAEALAEWRVRLHKPAHPAEEWFDIVDGGGEPLGLTAPRWFAHLTGLRHRVAHVYLTTPQGLLALQMRAHDKAEWPARFDTTVGGHLKAGQDWAAGVLAEIEEEIGLPAPASARWLVDGGLQRVGAPYERYGVDEDRVLHLRNRQINQLFSGRLSEWGLAHVHFADREVAGLYLCPPAEVQRMVEASFLTAPGLRHSFARWWAWYEGGDDSR